MEGLILPQTTNPMIWAGIILTVMVVNTTVFTLMSAWNFYHEYEDDEGLDFVDQYYMFTFRDPHKDNIKCTFLNDSKFVEWCGDYPVGILMRQNHGDEYPEYPEYEDNDPTTTEEEPSIAKQGLGKKFEEQEPKENEGDDDEEGVLSRAKCAGKNDCDYEDKLKKSWASTKKPTKKRKVVRTTSVKPRKTSFKTAIRVKTIRTTESTTKVHSGDEDTKDQIDHKPASEDEERHCSGTDDGRVHMRTMAKPRKRGKYKSTTGLPKKGNGANEDDGMVSVRYTARPRITPKLTRRAKTIRTTGTDLSEHDGDTEGHQEDPKGWWKNPKANRTMDTEDRQEKLKPSKARPTTKARGKGRTASPQENEAISSSGADDGEDDRIRVRYMGKSCKSGKSKSTTGLPKKGSDDEGQHDDGTLSHGMDSSSTKSANEKSTISPDDEEKIGTVPDIYHMIFPQFPHRR